MVVDMNRKKVLECAERALSRIYKWREDEIKKLVKSKINTSKTWNRRFRKIGLGFLHKVITEEYALKLIKSGTPMSDYSLVQITKGYREDRLKKIIRACKSISTDIVHLSDEDVHDLGINLT
jgi:hypothetical protein